jgi:hypothetical protein
MGTSQHFPKLRTGILALFDKTKVAMFVLTDRSFEIHFVTCLNFAKGAFLGNRGIDSCVAVHDLICTVRI